MYVRTYILLAILLSCKTVREAYILLAILLSCKTVREALPATCTYVCALHVIPVSVSLNPIFPNLSHTQIFSLALFLIFYSPSLNKKTPTNIRSSWPLFSLVEGHAFSCHVSHNLTHLHVYTCIYTATCLSTHRHITCVYTCTCICTQLHV